MKDLEICTNISDELHEALEVDAIVYPNSIHHLAHSQACPCCAPFHIPSEVISAHEHRRENKVSQKSQKLPCKGREFADQPPPEASIDLREIGRRLAEAKTSGDASAPVSAKYRRSAQEQRA